MTQLSIVRCPVRKMDARARCSKACCLTANHARCACASSRISNGAPYVSDTRFRWRVRAPTYPNLQAVDAMVRGQTIADVPITIGSLDPCFSCTERVEAVDLTDGSRQVYTRQELEAMARGAGLDVADGKGGGV